MAERLSKGLVYLRQPLLISKSLSKVYLRQPLLISKSITKKSNILSDSLSK